MTTIDHCPESDDGIHDPDYHGECRSCAFQADRGTWWDYYGGPGA